MDLLMRTSAGSAILALVTVAGMLSCSRAAAEPKPASTIAGSITERPGVELEAGMRGADCEGVWEDGDGSNMANRIEELTKAYGRGAYWVPPKSMMDDSRPQIARAMQHCRDSSRSYDELMRYNCQFSGDAIGGIPVLYAQCMAKTPCWWRNRIVEVLDGGDTVVYAKIRPADNTVVEIRIGGPTVCGPGSQGSLVTGPE